MRRRRRRLVLGGGKLVWGALHYKGPQISLGAPTLIIPQHYVASPAPKSLGNLKERGTGPETILQLTQDARF